MDLVKTKKLVHKAFKDYELVGKYDEEILVLFLLVDIFKEMNGIVDIPAKSNSRKQPLVEVITHEQTTESDRGNQG